MEKQGTQKQQQQQQLSLQKEQEDQGKKKCTCEYTQQTVIKRNEDFANLEDEDLLKFNNEITKTNIEHMGNLNPHNIFDDRCEVLDEVHPYMGTTLRTGTLSKNEKGKQKQKQKRTNIDKKKQRKGKTKIKMNMENGEIEEQETEKEKEEKNHVTATIKRHSQKKNTIPIIGKEECNGQEPETCISRMIDINRGFLRHLENEEEVATPAWNLPTRQGTQGALHNIMKQQSITHNEHGFGEDSTILKNQNLLANEEQRFSCKINNQKYFQFQQNFERNFENVHRFLSSFDMDNKTNDMSADKANIFLNRNSGGTKGFIFPDTDHQQTERHESPNMKSNNRRRTSRKASASSQNASARVYKSNTKRGSNIRNNKGDNRSNVQCDDAYVGLGNTNSMISNDPNHRALGIPERNIFPQQIYQQKENRTMQNYNPYFQTETSSQGTNSGADHFVNFSDTIEGLQVQRKTFADDPSLHFNEFIIPSYLLENFNFGNKEASSEKKTEETENKKQQETNIWSKCNEVNNQKTHLQSNFHRDDGIYRSRYPNVIEDNNFFLDKDIVLSLLSKSPFSSISRYTGDNNGNVNKTGISTTFGNANVNTNTNTNTNVSANTNTNITNCGKSEFMESGNVTCTNFTSTTPMPKQVQYGLWNYFGSDTKSRTIRDTLLETDEINKNNSRISKNNNYSDNKTKSLIEKLKSVSFSSKDGDDYINTHKNNWDLNDHWTNYKSMGTEGSISSGESQQVHMGGGHCCCCKCDCCKHSCNRHCGHYANKQMEDYRFSTSSLYTNRNNGGIHFHENQTYRRNEQKNEEQIMRDRFYGNANSSSIAPPPHLVNPWLQFQANNQKSTYFNTTTTAPNNNYSSNYASRFTGTSTGSLYSDHLNTVDRNEQTRQTEVNISEPEKELKRLEHLTEMIRRQILYKNSTSTENRVTSLQPDPQRPYNIYNKGANDKQDMLGYGKTLHRIKNKKKNKPDILKMVYIKKYYRYTRMLRELYFDTYKNHELTQLEQRLYNRYIKYKYWCWKKSKAEHVCVCNKLINKRESNATEEKKIRKKRYSRKLKDDGTNVKWRKANFKFLDKILKFSKKNKTKKEKGNNMGRMVQQQTQQSTQHVMKQSAQPMTLHSAQQTTEHVSHHMTQHVTQPVVQPMTQLPTQQMEQQMTHQMTQQTERHMAHQMAHPITQPPIQQVEQQMTHQMTQLPKQSITQQMSEFPAAANLMHSFINELDGFSSQKKCLNNDQRKNLAEIKRKGFFQRFILNDNTNLLKEFDTGVKQYIQNTHMKKKETDELKPQQDPLKNVNNGNKKNTQNENTTNHLRDVNRPTATNRIPMNTNKKCNNTSESNWKSQANGTGVKKYGSEKKKGKKQSTNWDGEEPVNKTFDSPSLEIDNPPTLKKFRQIVSKKVCNKMIMNSILTIQWNVNNLSYLYLNKTGYVVSPEYNTHTDLNRFFILLLINNTPKTNPSEFSVGIFFTYTGCCDIVFSVHCGIYSKVNVTYNLTMVPWFGFKNWGVLKHCVHDDSISITIRIHEIRVNAKYLSFSNIKTAADQDSEAEMTNTEQEKKHQAEEKQVDEEEEEVTNNVVDNSSNSWRAPETNGFFNFFNTNFRWETEMEQNKRAIEHDVGLGLGLDLDMGAHISDDDRETEIGACEEDEEEPEEQVGHVEQTELAELAELVEQVEQGQTNEGQTKQEQQKEEKKQEKKQEEEQK